MKFFAALQSVLPQHHLSRAIGWLAHLKHPEWLKNMLIRLFMRSYGISLEEAVLPSANDYPHFNAFFTRALQEGARPMASSRYVAPADGQVSQCGSLESGELLQAKGRRYTASALLGGDDELAEQFSRGSYGTVYLSPRDYHRVHMPTSGTLLKTRYIPGDLFAVNTATVHSVDQLFARNERLVCQFETADGPLVLVLVGAIIVAGIETVWGGVESPQPDTIREKNWHPDEAPTLAAGDELGRFFLGSTVIMMTTRELQWAVAPGDTVRVKAALAD